jgi:gliding motility-associated-like protein
MKKNIFLLLGLLISYNLFADVTHPIQTICEDQAKPQFQTNTTGNEYKWYKEGSTNPIHTGSNKYTPTTAGKYRCEVKTNGQTISTGNLLSAGDFNFTCSDLRNKTINGELYGEYTDNRGVKYLVKNPVCNPNDNTPAGFTSIELQSTRVKPSWFVFTEDVPYDGTCILVCDGMSSPNFRVWQAVGVSVIQGVVYDFSCLVANIDKDFAAHGSNSLPDLTFYIEYQDGTVTKLLDFNAPTNIAEKHWEPKTSTFTAAKTDNNCTIYIQNSTTVPAGNDFALDDIYFGTTRTTASTTVKEYFELKIDTKPNISLSGESNPCPNAQVTITPTITNAGSNPQLSWSGDCSGSANPLTINAASAVGGIKKCTLTVTNGTCNTKLSTEIITINCGTQSEDSKAYDPCIGTICTLSPKNAGTPTWKYEDGSPLGNLNINITDGTPLTFVCTVETTGTTGQPHTINETHTITPVDCDDDVTIPHPAVNPCPGQKVKLTLTTDITGANDYKWSHDASITTAQQYIEITAAESGSTKEYTCTFSKTEGRITTSYTETFTVVSREDCENDDKQTVEIKVGDPITIIVPEEERCDGCVVRWCQVDIDGNEIEEIANEVGKYTHIVAPSETVYYTAEVKNEATGEYYRKVFTIEIYEEIPLSHCYDAYAENPDNDHEIEGKTGDNDVHEWTWKQADNTEIEFPAEAVTVDGANATVHTEYFANNSIKEVRIIHRYQVQEEGENETGSNTNTGNGTVDPNDPSIAPISPAPSQPLALPELRKVTIRLDNDLVDKLNTTNNVNATKSIEIDENTSFKISDNYTYSNDFPPKSSNMTEHDGVMRFTTEPMASVEAYKYNDPTNRYVLEVDAGDTAGPIFSIDINKTITQGDPFYFTFLATATSLAPITSPAEIQFTITIDGQEYQLTDKLHIDHTSWNRYTFPFTIPQDGEHVIITLNSYNTSSGQNDFAIDDIEFYINEPLIAPQPDIAPGRVGVSRRNASFAYRTQEFVLTIKEATKQDITATSNPKKEYKEEVKLQKGETITFYYDPAVSYADGMDKYEDYKTGTNQYGCTHHVYFTLNLFALEPDVFFSPNGDEVHDKWLVKGIEGAPNAYIMIYDRYSKLLYKCKGSEFQGWDGKFEGHDMVQDDYWYVISVPETEEQMSGHFTLKR